MGQMGQGFLFKQQTQYISNKITQFLLRWKDLKVKLSK